MVLRKKEIVNRIAEKTGLTKKDVKAMMLAFVEIIYEEVKEGNSLVLKNVFKIVPVNIKAGKWYNPPSKQMEYRNEQKSVRITASQNLKESVR